MGGDRAGGSRSPHFSLVDGGAGVRLLASWGSSFPRTLSSVVRIAAALAAISWLPLALAALAEDVATGTRGTFMWDVGVHARLLLALPIAIVAEFPIGRRLGAAMKYLMDARLIDDDNRARAQAAIDRAQQLRDSRRIEPMLAVVAVGLSILDVTLGRHGPETWIFAGGRGVSAAGWIYLLFSAPLFRFIALRWAWRLVIWTTLLVGLARAPLHIEPAHPDRAGGLSVLRGAHVSFAWIALALGISFAGNLTTEKLLLGRSVMDYTTEITVFAVLTPFVLLLPLLAFAIPIELARRSRHEEYGSAAADFARRYAADVMKPESRTPLSVDTPCTSAHTDFVTSFEAVESTSPILLTRRLYLRLFAASAIPMLAFVTQEIPLLVLIRRVRDTIG